MSAKKKTYLQRILTVLSKTEKQTLKQIMSKLNICEGKTTYCIDALKKGMQQGLIIQYKSADEKRLLYAGSHTYLLAH